MSNLLNAAAYGGPGWLARTRTLRHEIGELWGLCGVETEWAPLRAVLLHRPGPELARLTDPDAAQMLDRLDAARASRQHDAIAQAYRDAGVTVHYVEPPTSPSPNLMFVADLLFMTPEGAVLSRPASTVRAGEERWVARRLAELGIPILRCVRGSGVFEGADAAWIDPQTVLLATGLRTNAEGAAQVTSLLHEMGVEVVPVGLPYGAMHLMGTLRFPDRDSGHRLAGPRALRRRRGAAGAGLHRPLFARRSRGRAASGPQLCDPGAAPHPDGRRLSGHSTLLRGRRHRLPDGRDRRIDQGGRRHRLPDRCP